MSLVLGFNAYIHDTAAALIHEGKLVAFGEEERFSRVKHTTEFPIRAIRFVLEKAGASINDVDDVAFYWDPRCGVGRRVVQTLVNLPGSARQLFRMQLGNFGNMRRVEQVFREKMAFRGRFHHINHYEAHAAGTFYPSPFDDALILIVDGNGEIATTWFGTGEGTRIRKFGDVLYPHSLGLLYCTVTEYLGFRQNCDEGKVMGLSAYGERRYLEEFRRMVRYEGGGRFRLDLSYFDFHRSRRHWHSKKWIHSFGPPRRKDEALTEYHKDVAYAAQTVLEENVMAMVRDLTAATGKRRLVFGGGVALNCVLNGKLVNSGLIDVLYVPPPAYDAGAAWGAALKVFHDAQPDAARDRVPSPYQGPEYSDAEIETALHNAGAMYERPGDIARAAAECLAGGLIVGRFDGRLEIGPRALGHRSILADPRPPDMKDKLNARVKHRESFRPFGPSVLESRADELFDTGGRRSPYMLEAFPVRQAWYERLPAVTHVDGTARIQTVREEDDPAYHALLSAFDALTGVPCVVNTSFNVMGEPIVNTPAEAIACFLSTGIDVCAIGPFLAKKAT
ncbi:MAG: carbamoyl transferase [Deltaproteobacteria bacterium]|nr:carbamoyl transferase [Deltaproteobacteria bacterium]